MTLIKIVLNQLLSNTATRACGATFRDLLLKHVMDNTVVEIDFTGTNLTPSFADEAFGLLCHHLSIHQFNKHIKCRQLLEPQKELLKRVIGNRFNGKTSS
ncbi:MAG: STAS-like domain-containing protein [Candidatus Berkiella sp.]